MNMPMDHSAIDSDLFTKSCQSLDWPRIIERLEAMIGSVQGQERARGMIFARDRKEAHRLQEQTTEIKSLLDDAISLPIGGIRDIRCLLTSAEKAEILVGQELLEIATTLKACHQLKGFFAHHADRCPKVQAVAARIPDLQDLSALLVNSFDNAGELSTTTYSLLGQLRSQIHSLHGRIKDKLTSILSSEDLSPLVQEQYVTVRAERYVIPLKIQARSMDVGIVHDTSGSGQTVFVEPRQIVSMNNDLKMAEAELRREERRILADLTRRVASEFGRISEAVLHATELEFIHARARLSQEIQGVPPVLTARNHIQLKNARHPLLVLRGVNVVPNDLSVGLGFQALILSGPNTGGKTVALKTLGLCALMARAGLHIPADPGSEVGFFETVLTDIGDQQTVEHDLSTFSGHILRIRQILEHIGDDASRALILLDEIAVGTDPGQGAALARAILEAFVQRGAKAVVTTHYGELKTMSVQDKRFANGRVEYDSVGLRPTFRVVIGHPGRSYALDIAEKLGMSTTLIGRARNYLAGGQRAMEDLLGELEQALSHTQDEKKLLERARKEVETRRNRYETRLVELEKEADQLRHQAIADFEREVRAAREEITRITRALQSGTGNRLAAARVAREKVLTLAKGVRAHIPGRPEEAVENRRPLEAKNLKVGMKVWVASLKKEGTVLTLSDQAKGPLEVMVGRLRVKVRSEDLRQPAASPSKQQDTGPKGARPASITPDRWKPQAPLVQPVPDDEHLAHAFQTSTNLLDLRGVRVDEGLDLVERFLDKAALKGETIVFIIHGHGTGAMKNAVREYLKDSPYVARFQPGKKNQGGDGATVVGLR